MLGVGGMGVGGGGGWDGCWGWGWVGWVLVVGGMGVGGGWDGCWGWVGWVLVVGGMGVGGGWETKGGLNHPLAQRKSCCVFSKAQKQLQCACQDKAVVGSSLTHISALQWHHIPWSGLS